MASFDMRGQRVTHQNIAGRDMYVGTIQTSSDLVRVLEQLRVQVDDAAQQGTIEVEAADSASQHIATVLQEVQAPQPNRQSVLDRLAEAKALLEGTAAAGGMITALTQAAEAVHKLFG